MAPSNKHPVVLPLAAVALAVSASCSQRTDLAPGARNQFSSKSQSMRQAPNAEQPAPKVAAAPVAAETAPVTTADQARAKEPVQQAAQEPPSTATPSAAEPVPTAQAATTPVPTATPLPASLNEPADAAAATEARRILMAASKSNWPALRAHALEAAIGHPSLLKEFVPAALADENRGVRFVACMAIAETRDTSLGEFAAPLLADASPSVRAAAMLALSRSGQKVNFTPLAEMLGDNDPEIRANAYLVLGELGNDSAVPLIRESLGRGMRLVNPLRVRLVDLAAAEALVKLGDETEVEPIRAALFAPPEQGELTIVACDSVRRLRDEVARPMLERIVAARGSAERSPEIRLAASRALNRLGNAGVAFTIAKEYAQHPDARIRGQVAVLLGEIGSAQARMLLSGLLKDTDPTVQIAAAGGLEPAERMSAGALKATAD